MCCLHLWTLSAQNYLLTFTSHAHLYNYLSRRQIWRSLSAFSIYPERNSTYLGALVSKFPEQDPDANGEKCVHFLSAITITSESIVISSKRGSAK